MKKIKISNPDSIGTALTRAKLKNVFGGNSASTGSQTCAYRCDQSTSNSTPVANCDRSTIEPICGIEAMNAGSVVCVCTNHK